MFTGSHHTFLDFDMSAWHLDSYPNTCVASMLSTEPSPQAKFLEFQVRLLPGERRLVPLLLLKKKHHKFHSESGNSIIIKDMWKCTWWPKRIYTKGLGQEYRKDDMTPLQCASSEQKMMGTEGHKTFKYGEVYATRQAILFLREPKAYYLETCKN